MRNNKDEIRKTKVILKKAEVKSVLRNVSNLELNLLINSVLIKKGGLRSLVVFSVFNCVYSCSLAFVHVHSCFSVFIRVDSCSSVFIRVPSCSFVL